MATIAFTNNAPVAGLPYNPGMEEVLDPTGTITAYTANLFEITNNDPGPFNGFKFQLISDPSDDFGYSVTGGVVTPNTGKVDAITVRAPDGTVIVQVTDGTNGLDRSLVDFWTKLVANADTPLDAIFSALKSLLNESNVVQGSAIGDHATAFGAGEVIGGAGDDVLWAPDAATSNGTKLVGGDGNDTIRIENRTYAVHGANADGTGGTGETNRLEVVGYVGDDSFAELSAVTDIDVLRFVDGDPPAPPSTDAASMGIVIAAEQVGAGLVSLTLAIDGSTTASPFSQDYIQVRAAADPAATSGVNLDLSGWTFTHWNQERNGLSIYTNSNNAALSDTIVGTRVADYINTYAGNDNLRGGGGADEVEGGDGNDTFVYGRNEAVRGESVDGGDSDSAGGVANTVLVLANNNFTGVDFQGIERLKFGGKAAATFDQNFIYDTNIGDLALGATSAVVIGDAHANTLAFQLTNPRNQPSAIDISDVKFKSWNNAVDKVLITGTNSKDTISGTTRGDVINGAGGSDDLQGNQGADKFLFNTAFGKGVDHIVDFSHKQHDVIQLEKDIFMALKKGALAMSAFTTGTKAKDANDRVIYDDVNGVIRYDADGTGNAKAKIFAILDDAAGLTAGDFFVI